MSFRISDCFEYFCENNLYEEIPDKVQTLNIVDDYRQFDWYKFLFEDKKTRNQFIEIIDKYIEKKGHIYNYIYKDFSQNEEILVPEICLDV